MNGLAGFFGCDEYVGLQEMGGGEMQGVHSVDSGLSRLTSRAFKNEADIIEYFDVLKVCTIEAEFKLTPVEERLGADLVPDKRTAQKQPRRIFEDSQRLVSELMAGAVGCNENAAVGKGADVTLRQFI